MNASARKVLLITLTLSALAACRPPATPVENVDLSDKELLGQKLFFDTNLSQPRGQSCASCHDPRAAFSGNSGSTLGVAPGALSGRMGKRNSPTLMYAKFIPAFHFEKDDTGNLAPIGGLFWDGRADTLEAQAQGPMFNPSEMNLPDHRTLRDRTQKSAYATLMKKIYGEQIFASPEDTLQAVTEAIAAYERTPVFAPFSSKYDAFRKGLATLTPLESEGLALYKDKLKGNCIACHVMNDASTKDEDNLFTDFSYDNLAVPRNHHTTLNADAKFFDVGLCGPDRGNLLKDRPDLCGQFRAPTLRNVSKRRAFFHNGVFDNLKDAVTFYATRETDSTRWYGEHKYNDTPAEFVANINTAEVPYKATPETGAFLNSDEIDAIIAFLGTLEDGYPTPKDSRDFNN